MIISFLYILLAILGLSFLIFIHELGHYYMARRVGMRVETFAIGFGHPIYTWQRDGVKWQIGWLLFGGYVKIAGQDLDDKRDPYDIPDGFFGKSPMDRIKVAFAGPLVNLVAAFVIFAIIWAIGGREKNFVEFTHKIGWVDPTSELYALGVRPGDEIVSYNDQSYQSVKDHLYAPMTSSEEIEVSGNHVDYATGTKTPFDLKVKTYPHPNVANKGVLTSGILNSANYIIYDKLPGGKENPLPEGSPMQASGIQYGDRIVWVDGELIHSGQELSHVLNDKRVLLTVVRGNKTLQMRVPRVPVEELRLDNEVKEELTDWQYEANLNGIKLGDLEIIPYNITNDGVVQNELKFIDTDNQLEAFPKVAYSSMEQPLLPQDKIIAVDGTPIKTAYDLLKQLQQRQVNVIVERGLAPSVRISSDTADSAFDKRIDPAALGKIAATIGTSRVLKTSGNYVLLNPVAPKMRSGFSLSEETQAALAEDLERQQKAVESIDDAEKRAHALAQLQKQEKLLLLGLPAVQDLKVDYNPTPINQFDNVFKEVWRTLKALFSGSLNPKWISGPIGIIQVVHDNSMVSLKEALFWLGAISLNLGMLNLLPIPVLDGGTIVLSLYELITKRRIHPTTLEKLVLPFAVLMIGFFIFLTYQDLSRILSRFIPW